MILNIIYNLFRLYYFLIFVRILLSWIPVNQYSQWVISLKKITDPYLDIFRRIIPPVGMVDISPIVAIFALELIRNVVIWLLVMVGIV